MDSQSNEAQGQGIHVAERLAKQHLTKKQGVEGGQALRRAQVVQLIHRRVAPVDVLGPVLRETVQRLRCCIITCPGAIFPGCQPPAYTHANFVYSCMVKTRTQKQYEGAQTAIIPIGVVGRVHVPKAS